MRRKDRELTDVDEIIRIVEKAKILHLGLFDSDYPYVLPLHYGYEYADGILVLYLHSAKEGHQRHWKKSCNWPKKIWRLTTIAG